MRDVEEIAAVSARDRWLIARGPKGGDVVAEAPDKVAALVDVARALGSAGIRFALVGGVAVGVHSGVPRATADTDLAVVSTVDRDLVTRVLTGAGFRFVGQFRHSTNFRHPSGEPVQLVFDTEFDGMIERAEHIDVGDLAVPIVGKDDLIAMKERAGHDPARRRSKALRDLADVELLKGDVPDPDEGW